MIKNSNKFKIYKVIIALLAIIISSLSFINSVYATTVNSAEIYSIGDCGDLLKYKGFIVQVSYVQYQHEGNEYPAYCMDKTKLGVGSTEPYTVSVNEMITDVGLWRVIVNGYPYKSIQELGVENKQEAFTATKQAIYCYIHGNNPDDYEPIGEAGERTLNAMKKIIENSQNSSETKVSNNIKIITNGDEWKQDTIDKKYLSKEFSILPQAEIKNYKVEINNQNGVEIGGIKLTNLQNEEKEEFVPNEKFKILIPIKNITESGNINIKIKTQMATKPVLYGTAPNNDYQDYALVGEIYEDSIGETNDYYAKNETKIIITKQDKNTDEPLENVEFELLDENKNVVYANLKTNKEGRVVINNLVPGKYYIRETNTINGYEKYDELIDAGVSLQEELTVKVYNNKEDVPNIEVKTSERSKEVESKKVYKIEEVKPTEEINEKEIHEVIEVKKLPVTGM